MRCAALHAVMCGAGANMPPILAALRLYCACFGLSLQANVAALIAAPVLHPLACD
jgi:IS5 family transposase